MNDQANLSGEKSQLDCRAFQGIYRERRVLVTGHTGFKGSWLTLWLQELGAIVTGISLPSNTSPSHWKLLDLSIDDNCLDIRDPVKLRDAIARQQPEIVFHLAAQSLVRQSYRAPLETWSTNVTGTANVLEACRQNDSVRAIVVVTSDKCYQNEEWEWGYRENDRLGGHDPYSASKAAAELVVASYRKSFFESSVSPLIATARAGNVIGGGDWSEDRLVPDLVRSIRAQDVLTIRSPNATRPWQHVLESLSGYMQLGKELLEGKRENAKAWNFGPASEGNRSVSEVLARLSIEWPTLRYQLSPDTHVHEAQLLYLDSTMARKQLKWLPVWDFDRALSATALWYRSWIEDGRVISREQLVDYVAAAREQNVGWSRP
jgi:CDP-glucose 4,6-dehydratase